MQSIGNPENYKRIVRTVFLLKDGTTLENIWNVEGLFEKYCKKIKSVIIEEINRDCFVKKLDEFKGSEVENVYTPTLYYQAAARMVYVGKTILLKSGRKITYFIDGQVKDEKTGGKK